MTRRKFQSALSLRRLILYPTPFRFSVILIFSIFCLFSSAGFTQNSQGLAWPKLADKIDDLVLDVMKTHHILGMTVAVSKDGRLLLSKGYGLAGFSKGTALSIVKMSRKARTRIGSVSKVVVTAPTAYKLFQEKKIDPFTKTLFGNTGVFRFAYNFDIEVGSRRFRPIAAMAISPDDKVFTWYVNGLYSVGSSKDLDRYQAPQPFSLPKGYQPTDIRAIAISRKNRVYVWYRDGRRSIGRADDLDSKDKPEPDELVEFPEGKNIWNVLAIAIAKSNDHVYVWYDDGTVSSGRSMNFKKYFSGKSFVTPTEEMGKMSRYDIRGIGIAHDDRVFAWYSNGKVSIGTSKNLEKYKAPYDYSIPGSVDNTNPYSWHQKITLNHILTHQSGFERDFDHSGAVKTMFPNSLKDKDVIPLNFRLMHFLRTRPLRWKPGSKWSYSNVGFALWSLIFPRLADGQSYDYWAKEKFLAPLGLELQVRLKTDKPDQLDAMPYNYDPDEEKLHLLDFKVAGEERSAGGWTASAQSLLWITRYLSRNYTVDELKDMGWQPKGNPQKHHEKLHHNGVTGGGIAYVVMFPEGYTSGDGRDLSNVHVALASNTRPLNVGDNKAQTKAISALESLASRIARAVPESDVPTGYNIWGGFPEWARHGVPEHFFPYIFELGYRPIWIDGYNVKGKTFFNVLFRPENNIPWVARHGLSAAQYQALFNKWSKEGYRLQQVESYVDHNAIRYAAIFVKKSGPAWKTYHGTSPEKHQQLFNSLTAQGYCPVNISVVSAQGKIQITALYEKKQCKSFVALSKIPESEFQKTFETYLEKGMRLTYLNAWRHKGKVYFSAIWYSSPKETFVTRHGLSASQYQTEWEKQRNKGYLTQFVTGYELNQVHRFAALWIKPKKKSNISTSHLKQ